MRYTVMLAGVLALAGMLATPAHAAGCADSVKAVEKAVEQSPDAAKKAEAKKHLDEAKSHLDMGHEDVCEQHVAAARAALDGAAGGSSGGY